MRHLVKGRKLNRTSSHRKSLMSNMSCSLVKHKRIITTEPKAKELRSFIERLVTYAKKGDVHGRRLIMRKIKGKLKKEISKSILLKEHCEIAILNFYNKYFFQSGLSICANKTSGKLLSIAKATPCCLPAIANLNAGWPYKGHPDGLDFD